MKKIFTAILLIIAIKANCQNYILKPGDKFPDIVIGPIINSPVQNLLLSASPGKKIYIINLWGTWCAPCIPEMDTLTKLQTKYNNQIQVIGLSDESVDRLKKYADKKPSAVWLASDTSALLYRMLNLAYVGQSIVIDASHHILALRTSQTIKAATIDSLLKGEKITSNGEVAERASKTDKDAFGVDSLLDYNFTIRGYMTGQQAMGRTPGNGPFSDRRVSYYNTGLVMLYKVAYDIVSDKQIIYNIDKKKYDNWKDHNMLYCVDLLVKPDQKDSLYLIMQKKLQESLPVKARMESREMDVYLLKTTPGKMFRAPESTAKQSYGFSGRGFDGQGVTPAFFAKTYLSNELDLPVVDETGLDKKYDIKTTVDLRNKEGVISSVNAIGLTLEKSTRKVDVIILYQ